MKKSILIVLFTCSFASIYAQDDFEEFKRKAQQEYKGFHDQSIKEYNDFRDRANAEFAEFMRQSWDSFQSFKSEPFPEQPKPVTPPQVEPKRQPTADPIPFKEIKPLFVEPMQPKPIVPIPPGPKPVPVEPVEEPVQPVEPEKPAPPLPVKLPFAFSFYNAACQVNLEASHRFSLRDASENTVADAWEILSDSRYNDLLNDCLALRSELNLSDWGYMEMLKTLSEKFFGKPCNEALLLEMFILSQSGYKVRLARAEEKLVLLVPFQQKIYQYVYIPIDGKNYYVLDKSFRGGGQFNVLNHEFPNEQQASLKSMQPNFPLEATPEKTFASKYNPDLSVNVSTNKNLIDFYQTYPLSSEWNLYAQASLSDKLKQDLYPVLQQQIAGKSEKDAANMLLQFVQTAFKYQTDDQQFGYERPLFADESFFYPANDCEDRSILFSSLVKDLMHLDVVLLHYPGHLATAVNFQEKITGDYMNIDGKTYVVCDPTYMGASIGMAMPEFKTTSAEVARL